ncbi:hypothetical protein HED55_07090 [Ochrobactrum haematophilum]|uniref:Uncharacterized protein n=1 Tax=Brucella haematophila TaxID=419474 RepID=A0ABX1DJY3_9HYPH|nr:hypothetical protein [Brucella haematophila]
MPFPTAPPRKLAFEHALLDQFGLKTVQTLIQLPGSRLPLPILDSTGWLFGLYSPCHWQPFSRKAGSKTHFQVARNILTRRPLVKAVKPLLQKVFIHKNNWIANGATHFPPKDEECGANPSLFRCRYPQQIATSTAPVSAFHGEQAPARVLAGNGFRKSTEAARSTAACKADENGVYSNDKGGKGRPLPPVCSRWSHAR